MPVDAGAPPAARLAGTGGPVSGSQLHELVCGTFDDGTATGTARVTSPARSKVKVRSSVWAGLSAWLRETRVTVGAFRPRKTELSAGIAMSSARPPDADPDAVALLAAEGVVVAAAPDGVAATTVPDDDP